MTMKSQTPTQTSTLKNSPLNKTEHMKTGANSTKNNPKETYRILADGIMISNDTTRTHINNNDMIIGPTGSGKTRYYCKPNIMQANESMIITDTKGVLYEEMAYSLEKAGYRVLRLDFDNVRNSCGYNPFDYIHRDSKDKFSEKDILTMASCLVPLECTKDPYWELAGQFLISSVIAFLLEFCKKEDWNISSMMRLFRETATDTKMRGANSSYQLLIKELEKKHPDSFAVKQYKMADCTAEKTASCVRSICASHLRSLDFDGIHQIVNNPKKVDLKAFGRRKCALFVNVSDTDRSMDCLVNLFYTQALHVLCYEADHCFRNHRLPVPVRFYFDDFAASTFIPDFDKIISVIRSRNIAVSVILQSISQLEHLYGSAASATILNGCDTMLYLGGQDVQTSNWVAQKANCPLGDALYMPLDKAYLFVRGNRPKIVSKYDLTHHPKYPEIREAVV